MDAKLVLSICALVVSVIALVLNLILAWEQEQKYERRYRENLRRILEKKNEK